MTATFKDALAVALSSGYHPTDSYNAAEDVLDMPEMVNIKNALRHFGQVCCWTRGDEINNANAERHLRIQGVLPAVAEWVMS